MNGTRNSWSPLGMPSLGVALVVGMVLKHPDDCPSDSPSRMSKQVVHRSRSPRCMAAGQDRLGKMDRSLVFRSARRVWTRHAQLGVVDWTLPWSCRDFCWSCCLRPWQSQWWASVVLAAGRLDLAAGLVCFILPWSLRRILLAAPDVMELSGRCCRHSALQTCKWGTTIS